MPIPKGLEEHCFKPGQTGNPKGRPKEPEELKFYRNNARNGMLTYFMKAIQTKLSDLKSTAQANQHQMLAYEAMAIKLITEAISKGSLKHMELCLKLLKIKFDAKDVEILKEEVETGLEDIPTEKLEQIQAILEA